MKTPPRRWRRIYWLCKNTVFRYSDNGGALLSAALAFYSILSIAPLVLVAVSVAGLAFGEEAASGQLQHQLSRYVGLSTAKNIGSLVEALRTSQGGHSTAIIGFALVLFTASRLFSQTQDALNQLWRVRTEFKTIKIGVLTTLYKKLLSFALVFLLGMLFTAFLIAGTLASTIKQLFKDALPGSEFVWQVTPIVSTFFFVAVMFTLIYRWMPDARVSWKDCALGAGIAAVLFTLAEYPMSFYLSHQGVESAYGAAGSLVVFLLWVYYSAQIFFLGAQFSRVYADACGRTMEPDAMAVLVKEVVVSAEEKATTAVPQ